jgi:proteasome lid subunit RPN8/RPN11
VKHSSEHIPISAATLEEIHEHAREAAPLEMMGFLGARPGEAVVSHALLLRARASAAFAEADPLAVREAVEKMTQLGYVPRGIFHSHGHGSVFHSGTDKATIARLFPAIADRNWRATDPPCRAPVVADQDIVFIPTGYGAANLKVSLLGAPIPGIGGYERVGWTFQEHRTSSVPFEEPCIQIIGNRLTSGYGHVDFTLG